MVDMLKTIAHFYHHESCGQCTPCREGCGWIEKLLIDLEAGRGQDGRLKVMLDAAGNMEGNTICVLADSLSMPVKSFVPKYVARRVRSAHQARALSIQDLVSATGCVTHAEADH